MAVIVSSGRDDQVQRARGRTVSDDLDFVRDNLPDWDRDDNAPPNFFRNAKKECPLREWYPQPEFWAKSYELMSCLDGILEYYRVTGDRRCLDTVDAIRGNLAATELNPLGSVGFGDKLIGGAVRVNALNEVCDVIHWIRLNLDLFLITGEDKYLDSMELGYFNVCSIFIKISNNESLGHSGKTDTLFLFVVFLA